MVSMFKYFIMRLFIYETSNGVQNLKIREYMEYRKILKNAHGIFYYLKNKLIP